MQLSATELSCFFWFGDLKEGFFFNLPLLISWRAVVIVDISTVDLLANKRSPTISTVCWYSWLQLWYSTSLDPLNSRPCHLNNSLYNPKAYGVNRRIVFLNVENHKKGHQSGPTSTQDKPLINQQPFTFNVWNMVKLRFRNWRNKNLISPRKGTNINK